jgi:diguanylate cyclase (GGDEF)-like protein/PAS domain S-box-containing protein
VFLAWRPVESTLWTNVLALPLGAWAGALALRTTRHPSIDARVRTSWRLLACGIGCCFLGDLGWLYVEDVLGRDPTGSWVDIPYLAYYPFVLAGLGRLPSLLSRRSDSRALALDVAATAIGGAMLIGWFVLRPALGMNLSGSSAVVAAAYPVADMAVLVAVARVILRQNASPGGRPLVIVAAALLANLIGNLCWAVLSSVGQYETGGWADALWVVFYAVLGVAATVARAQPDLRLDEMADAPYRLSLTPYLGAAGGYALVLGVAAGGADPDLAWLVAASVLLSAVLMARQVFAVRASAALEAEAAHRVSELRFRNLVQHSSDSILVLDKRGAVRYATESAWAVLGHRADTLLKRRFETLAAPEDAPMVAEFVRDAARQPSSPRSLTWRVRRSDGGTRTIETVVTNLLEDPGVDGLVANSRDVTDQRALEDQLSHQAFHDALTGLPNRALFRDRVEHAIAKALRGGRTVAVLFVDLDNFKTVNDSLGHAAGDRVLVAAAERIRRCQRAEDTASRLGGDEFAVLLDDVAAAVDPAEVANRITSAFTTAFDVDGRAVIVTASVGVAVASPGDSADVLLRNADAAMYVAKGEGRGRWRKFESVMHASALAELELRGDLHAALERDEFRVVYQPIVSIRDGKTRGAEALLRWEHPRRGPLSPASFLALAEQTGAIIPIGAWVLQRACADLERWRAERPDLDPYVSVNVSSRQLQSDALVEHVRKLLPDAGLPASALLLEITESGLVDNQHQTIGTLRALRALGLRIAVDDFGTGYSSLEYLQRLPLDVLKIPKTFVDGLSGPEETRTLPHAILSIASTLGLDVVAEGVEDEAQAHRLAEMGCEFAQGYWYARPMELDALIRWTATSRQRWAASDLATRSPE